MEDIVHYRFTDTTARSQGELLFRLVEGAPVVLFRSERTAAAEMVAARYDLYRYDGGFAWGYSGSGPTSLSHALAAKVFGRDVDDAAELQRLAYLILERVVARLDGDVEHDVPVAEITPILAARSEVT